MEIIFLEYTKYCTCTNTYEIYCYFCRSPDLYSQVLSKRHEFEARKHIAGARGRRGVGEVERDSGSVGNLKRRLHSPYLVGRRPQRLPRRTPRGHAALRTRVRHADRRIAAGRRALATSGGRARVCRAANTRALVVGGSQFSECRRGVLVGGAEPERSGRGARRDPPGAPRARAGGLPHVARGRSNSRVARFSRAHQSLSKQQRDAGRWRCFRGSA